MKAILTTVVLLGVAGAGLAYYASNNIADPGPNLRTAAVKGGDLLSTISAVRTVET